MIGTRWVIIDEDQTIGTVVAEETSHVLVELEGIENRWGGPERRWISKGGLRGPIAICIKKAP